jgi:AraC-like DNA-binding protein
MKSRSGRPRFKPSTQQRRLVGVLRAAKLTEDDIATVIGIAPQTLRGAFRAELETAPRSPMRSSL